MQPFLHAGPHPPRKRQTDKAPGGVKMRACFTRGARVSAAACAFATPRRRAGAAPMRPPRRNSRAQVALPPCDMRAVNDSERRAAPAAPRAPGRGWCAAASGERGEARVLGGVLEAHGLAHGPSGVGACAELAVAGGAAEAVHVPHAARPGRGDASAPRGWGPTPQRVGLRCEGRAAGVRAPVGRLQLEHGEHLGAALGALAGVQPVHPLRLVPARQAAVSAHAAAQGAKCSCFQARTRARIRTRSPAASCSSPCASAAAAACAPHHPR